MDEEQVERLKSWFRREQRRLPWRGATTPYAIWVSEVMLQQTRAEVVIPYFLRWMKLFPSIQALADAEEADVIKAWEGLGYYSRARRLREGARQLVQEHGGKLPRRGEELLSIPGIGPYTAGAIRAFAFGDKSAAVDGNVMRVLARYYAIEEEIQQRAVQQQLWQKAEALLPDDEPALVTEGLIELGALICTKVARCDLCPVREGCQALAKGLVDQLPRKRPGRSTVRLQRLVALVRWQEKWLLRQVEKGKLMEGLWEFPYYPLEPQEAMEKVVEVWLTELLGNSPREAGNGWELLEPLSHAFTRYQVELYPLLILLKQPPSPLSEAVQWVEGRRLESLPFPSGHRQLAAWASAYEKELMARRCASA